MDKHINIDHYSCVSHLERTHNISKHFSEERFGVLNVKTSSSAFNAAFECCGHIISPQSGTVPPSSAPKYKPGNPLQKAGRLPTDLCRYTAVENQDFLCFIKGGPSPKPGHEDMWP